jgi:hypothetical protein
MWVIVRHKSRGVAAAQPLVQLGEDSRAHKMGDRLRCGNET